jgi:hypothetical protein
MAEGLDRLDAMLGEAGRSRRDLTITVCPYFNELNPERVARYAEAGADRVAAMFFVGSAEEVPAAFDALAPCLERAASL